MTDLTHASDLSRLGDALGHELRVKLLLHYEDGRRFSPKEAAEELGTDLGVTAYHARTLRDLGFLKKAGTKPARGAVIHYYRLSTDGEWVVSCIHQLTDNLKGRRLNGRPQD